MIKALRLPLRLARRIGWSWRARKLAPVEMALIPLDQTATDEDAAIWRRARRELSEQLRQAARDTLERNRAAAGRVEERLRREGKLR